MCWNVVRIARYLWCNPWFSLCSKLCANFFQYKELPFAPIFIQPELRDQETQSNTLPAPLPVQQLPQQPVIEERAFKQTITKRSADNYFSSKDNNIVGKVGSFTKCFCKWIIY